MNKYVLLRNMPSVTAFLIVFILILLVSFVVRGYLEENDKLTSLENEVTTLQDRVNVLKTNTSLVKEQIDDYNQLLTQLIPEREDFFSIIYALENLSISTGFTITNYAINLSASTKERYSIVITGEGDPQTFLKFLENYSFAGGRLITNEKIDFSSSGANRVRLSVNFYNKKVPTNIESVEPVVKKDLELMEKIKGKLNIILKTDTSIDAENYPTKENPF